MNATVTAALLSLFGVLVGILATRELEYLKWRRSAGDDFQREIRSTLGGLASTLAKMAHSQMWFTYQINNSAQIPSKLFESYNSETHALIAEAVAAQVKLAALDKNVYETITPYVSEIINLSEEIDRAVASKSGVFDCNQKALEYVKKLPIGISNMMA